MCRNIGFIGIGILRCRNSGLSGNECQWTEYWAVGILGAPFWSNVFHSVWPVLELTYSLYIYMNYIVDLFVCVG